MTTPPASEGQMPESAGSIIVNVRSAFAPYETLPVSGYMPFEIFGERFVVTRIPAALNNESQWRVSHVETGAAVPRTESATVGEAAAKCMAYLTDKGPEKLKAALDKVKALIDNRALSAPETEGRG